MLVIRSIQVEDSACRLPIIIVIALADGTRKIIFVVAGRQEGVWLTCAGAFLLKFSCWREYMAGTHERRERPRPTNTTATTTTINDDDEKIAIPIPSTGHSPPKPELSTLDDIPTNPSFSLPTDQTIHNNGNNNSFQSCVAEITPTSSVPHPPPFSY